ncbi:MAG: tRNA (guanosine(37)-N1)-methyltransferase TrmD [Candidatus Methylumidiphilus sp.]
MRFDIITLFPEMVQETASWGVTGRALELGLAELVTWNPRDFAHNKYRTVDDRPYGGGPGMVMKVEPLRDAIAQARNATETQALVVYLSPQGRVLNQDTVRHFANLPRLVLIAGRYEGVDERLLESAVDEEWSIGDYVLSGGELAALVVFDAVVRLLPGVLGHEESAAQDSHMAGLLDCPHYTRPVEIDGKHVPDILQSGNHEAIRRWRLKQSLGRTWQRRPDLIATQNLDAEQRKLLEEFKTELNDK